MKTKKKKSKKEFKSLLTKIVIAFVILFVVGIGVFYFLTAEDEESSLTLLEKQWVEKNKTTLIDIEIPNNINIVSLAGEGIVFDFLDDFEKTTELTFNKIPYNYPSKLEENNYLAFAVLKNTDELKKDDILLLEDNYVLVGLSEEYINDLSSINNKTVGVLESDLSIVSSSFNEYVLNQKKYSSINELLTAVKNGSVNYAIIPRYAYLDKIYEKELNINYSFANLTNKLVLRLGKDEKLNNIISKSFNKWLTTSYNESFEKSLLSFYETKKTFSEIEKSNLSSRVYKYGYIKNAAYNVSKNGKLYGVAGEYINSLANMLNMEFNYIEYSNKKELEKDIANKKLDIAYVNYDYKNNNYFDATSTLLEKMVVLSNDYKNITNTNGLINNKVYTLNNNYLYDYLKKMNCNLTTIKDYNEKIPTDSLLAIDESEYLYLKNSDFASYKLLFTDTYEGNNHFIVKSNNETLFKLLQYVLSNTDYEEYRARGINNLLLAQNNQTNFKEIYIILLGIILLPIFVIFLSIVIIRNSKNLKIIKKENILRYNDVLTNLKNRNYLNDNIDKWDDTRVYPKTIIIVDLNNLKYVNDNYGHEEGNNLIKKAAAVLINTQLEKSEIVRTDGNEFLIYLLGYSEKQVATYVSKLSKEFEKLPHEFGAAVGYSMIDDEIKTTDDAINEATIQMRVDKQNYK